MLDLVSVLMLFVFLVGFWGSWKLAKHALNGPDDLPVRPISRDTPDEALRRAKRRRVRAEHDLWDTEFAALSSRRLCSCGSPAHRSRH